MKIRMTIIAALLLCTFNLRANNIRIGQVDPSTLLVDQKVKLYVSITDQYGVPVRNVDENSFTVYESKNGYDYKEIESGYTIKKFINYEEGIHFFLMIDNSGSMYKKVGSETCFSRAQKAITEFLSDISNPKDTVALASYNTNYNRYGDVLSDPATVESALLTIEKPSGDDVYTEIYGSLYHAVQDISSIEGRKVILVLSDGVNSPYTAFTGKDHPEYGQKIFSYTEPLDICHQEGVTVFAIHYGSGNGNKDFHLAEIALQSGGAVFSAENEDELSGVYSSIVGQLLNEYQLVYDASMIPANKRYVRLSYQDEEEVISSERFYFASTVLGLPLDDLVPPLFIPLLLALTFLVLIARLKFEKQQAGANLEVLDCGNAKDVTRFLSLSEKRTIIGTGACADMTINGSLGRVKESHASIEFDPQSKSYTLVSDSAVSINNNRVKRKQLEPGDVINVEGTKIVFDDSQAK